jgi:hypothetical protein
VTSRATDKFFVTSLHAVGWLVGWLVGWVGRWIYAQRRQPYPFRRHGQFCLCPEHLSMAQLAAICGTDSTFYL